MNLPAFKYHPDPLASGSVAPSNKKCVRCGKASGYVYTATAYAEEDYDDNICPWCIADGSAHRDLGVEFFDCEGIGDVPDAVMEEIMQRTPGYASFQPGKWPACCDDATAFLGPVGIAEVRRDNYEWEGALMTHIVQKMSITGGAARRLLESLHKDTGPTAYTFRCLHCNRHHFHIDYV